jgi:hypothetical protein
MHCRSTQCYACPVIGDRVAPEIRRPATRDAPTPVQRVLRDFLAKFHQATFSHSPCLGLSRFARSIQDLQADYDRSYRGSLVADLACVSLVLNILVRGLGVRGLMQPL